MHQVMCAEVQDAETTVVLNGDSAEPAGAQRERPLQACDEDKVVWAAPANEASMDEPESKGVSEVLFTSMKAILNGMGPSFGISVHYCFCKSS